MYDSQAIFPPQYPIPYFQSRHFIRNMEAAAAFLPFDHSKAKIYSQTPLLHNRLLADFDRIQFERCGKMLGDYVTTGDGLVLIDRTGNCFSINFPWDSSLVSRRPFDEVNDRAFWDHRRKLLDNWDSVPMAKNATVWSHIYHTNYYHFTFELLQKARLASDYPIDFVLIPHLILSRQFQRDLLSRVIVSSQVVPMKGFIRVVDPVIADGWQSDRSLTWLRQTMNFGTGPGENRYYVRRATSKRSANNISESADFLDFIRKYEFKVVDFGTGEIPVAEQIDMVRGASIILSPHGAGLTNLAYLNPPLAVIECFSRRVLSASFMQIALNLGFRYFGIISEHEDTEKCIVTDVALLEQIMEQIL